MGVWLSVRFHTKAKVRESQLPSQPAQIKTSSNNSPKPFTLKQLQKVCKKIVIPDDYANSSSPLMTMLIAHHP